MEEIRDELYECIKKYGTSDIRTLEKSQQLDEFIKDDMKEKLNSRQRETFYSI